jgi:hypothetical protein
VVGTTQHELPVGRPPHGVVLVMEIGSSFVRLVEKEEGIFKQRSLKK